MKIICNYIDTCLPDYLNDHCNGDNELLIGVYSFGQDIEEAADQMLNAALNSGKIPNVCNERDLYAACFEAAKNVDWRWINEFDDKVKTMPEDSSDLMVWFRLSWDEECDHEDTYCNDRSQEVCRTCGEELGR